MDNFSKNSKPIENSRMWQNLWNFFKYLFLLEQIFFVFTNFRVLAMQSICVGSKHQMQVDILSDLVYEELEPIEFIDFDKMPNETIIENNGYVLAIDLKFNDTVPMIKINFESTLAVKGTFRLESLYFQWFKQVPEWFAYENLTFPAELHAIFYDVKLESFERALNKDKSVVILAFEIEIDPLQPDGFDVLLENLKYVRESDDATPIDNRNLTYWLKSATQRFYIYEGSFLEIYCKSSVTWIDFVDTLSIKPEVVEEFEKLNANDGKPLMRKYSTFLKPQGNVYKNLHSKLPIGSAPIPPLSLNELDGTSGGEMTGQFKMKQMGFLLIIMFCLF